jgi:glycosyltransferase involved in cell wall biosynthesis
MKVLVLAEYYPRAGEGTRGIWAHRQALAARDAGAEIAVAVLHRPIPPIAAVKRLDAGAIAAELRQPPRAELDGLAIRYVRYLSPPRPLSYGTWGAWAAPALKRALDSIHGDFDFDLIHAHYAVPAGDAARRVAAGTPLVVSIHGGDLYGIHAAGAGARAVRATLGHARVVLANSAGTARRCAALGARATRVVHLGGDLKAAPAARPGTPTIVTVANLIERKRHADVIDALALIRDRHPGLSYVVAGDGPEREAIRARAESRRVPIELRGRIPNEQAAALARAATIFVLPSVDEAFGVAYVEAMAGGVPAIGCAGEDGPEEIAAAGGGIVLVPRNQPQRLADEIDRLLVDTRHRQALGDEARENVNRTFTWARCGVDTVDAYSQALAGG